MRARWLFIALGTIILLGFVGPPAHAARQATGTYVGPARDPFTTALVYAATNNRVDVICAPSPETSGMGGACFDVQAGESTVSVEIDDASGLPVSGYVRFVVGDDSTQSATFCGSATIDIPSGATRVVVAVEQFNGCPPPAVVPGSGGTIAATFT